MIRVWLKAVRCPADYIQNARMPPNWEEDWMNREKIPGGEIANYDFKITIVFGCVRACVRACVSVLVCIRLRLCVYVCIYTCTYVRSHI